MNRLKPLCVSPAATSRTTSPGGWMCRDVVVQGNPRVYKALRHISADYERFKRAFGPQEVEQAVEADRQRDQAEKGRKRPRRWQTINRFLLKIYGRHF